ncbi:MULTISPECIES: hypothetical protein [Terrabacteria group]|uniref:hypothetical protein n=1 Tax=Bacillati TaxID=1783272 RepID=UPI001939999A|nr:MULTISPECIES: hypothetical protein [Terrabacteria group]MBW9212318.1 hypothetical protein [Trueperella sp. zg.1013]QRG86145.1 hypothetical protein JOS54_04530 [Bulleidia sp. zg-1006]
MEDYEKKILDAIEQGVKSESQMVLDTLKNEINQIHDETLTLYKKGLQQETKHYLEKEFNDLRAAVANQKSQVKFEYMQSLLNMRLEYISEMVSEVEQRIHAFVKSDQYRTYLVKNLEKAPVLESGYFYVREEDKDLFQSILDEKSMKNEIKIRYFQFGGFSYIDFYQGLEFSCALKERLDESLDWFRSHSGFILEGGN